MGTITRLDPGRGGRQGGSDGTPRSPRRPSPTGNRSNDPRSRAHLLILVALGAAAAVGGLLWITRTNGSGGSPEVTSPASSTAASAEPGVTEPPADNAVVAAPERPVGANGLAGVTVFDPDGDRKEMNQLANNVLDGQPSTLWTTVCYASRYMGGKKGVGLVADLGHTTSGTLSVGVASAPFQVRVWSSDAAEPPSTFAEWGQPLRAVAGSAARTLTVKVDQPSRWVLVAFVEVLKELPATLLIRPFNFDTLAVGVYRYASDERLAEAAVGAVAIVAVSLIPVILLSRAIAGRTGSAGITSSRPVP